MGEIQPEIKTAVGLPVGLALVAVILGAVASMAADPVCGDVNKSNTVSTADALLVLRKAVGVPILLQCAPPSVLLQTGQNACYSAGAAVPCAGTGQDGESQHGVTASYTDNGDGTISDSKTGLMWEKLDDDNLPGPAGIHDWDNHYNWNEAFGKVSDLNGSAFAGHADWRLPNLRELESLDNFGFAGLAIDPKFSTGCVPGCTSATCSCTQPYVYWTSSTYQDGVTYAWCVYFFDGRTDVYPKTYSGYFRAVRGGF